MTTNFIGLSISKPNADGSNLNENLWPNYARHSIDISSWLVSGTSYVNDVPLTVFGQTDGPANTFYTASYFFINNAGNHFVCAGSLGPPIYLGQNAIITFPPSSIQFDTSVPTSYLPTGTINLAVVALTYPPYVPTYEPAALSQPILYNRNMRS